MQLEPYMLKTYKQRRADFKRSFKNTDAESSCLISDYSCALVAGSPKILQQGRMYITTEFICFYSRIITFEQKIIIGFDDVIEITKEKTAMVFQNAIQIVNAHHEKIFFSSFATRDRTFHVIYKLWREHKEEVKLSIPALWDRVRGNYGNELGFSIDDSEYEESSATQFTARYSVFRKPSEVLRNSSPENSIYESVEESSNSDCLAEYSSSNRYIKLRNHTKRDSINLSNDEEGNVKFDLSFQNKVQRGLYNDTCAENKENSEKILPPASCSGHEHYPNILMDEEFNINVSTLWSYIFTDSPFYRAFCSMRLITDITQSYWSDGSETDPESCRTIYYTVHLKNKIGPKKSSTIEKQVQLEGTIKNYIYYTESSVQNLGIPMSDAFHVVVRYCILYVNPNRSRIKVSMKIEYDKPLFFPKKSIIDSSVKSACIDYNKDLKQALLIESKKANDYLSDQKIYCTQRSIEDTYHAPVEHNSNASSTDSLINFNSETRISWILMVIICCISFLALYIFKELYSESSTILQENTKVRINSKEIDHTVISEIMKIIKEMKHTIDILKMNIEMLNGSQNCS